MLKIKDYVNLKELYKFGFVYKEYEIDDILYKEYTFKDEDGIDFYINAEGIYKGYIMDEHFSFAQQISDEILDVLYDLIKADLVEKIENAEE